ncbi:general secretion pathway protein GspB [Pelomonas cellulosilytica]|uniref:General secretion pathway protein GspB n=1 Tax=Pelomonas cellulosilytica TaxID=2906762 RepID=A0ABS8Y166_9BURK|nr:general secretion pathway protein GspB [Pelomonas sp. P8]MCE4557335.1 general secretion pathway protein GspB [Pelomonas sp. P8]
MSYILDALRRAEADRERERGQVPGLHTQPPSGSDATPSAPRRAWLPWVGGGLLLVAGVGAGSWFAASPGNSPAPATPATPPPATVPQPAATAPPAPATVASASPYLPPAPPPVAIAPAPAPVSPPLAPTAEAPIPRLAELPDSLRRELPKLAISGSVYSDDPAGRFVIINGDVQREGARLGADLVLEQIRPRELVLRFKGQRFRQAV